MPELRATRQLEAIEAASVPYMDKGSHRDTIRRLTRQIDAHETPVAASDGDLAAIGIQVERVPKEVN